MIFHKIFFDSFKSLHEIMFSDCLIYDSAFFGKAGGTRTHILWISKMF